MKGDSFLQCFLSCVHYAVASLGLGQWSVIVVQFKDYKMLFIVLSEHVQLRVEPQGSQMILWGHFPELFSLLSPWYFLVPRALLFGPMARKPLYHTHHVTVPVWDQAAGGQTEKKRAMEVGLTLLGLHSS